MYRRLLYIIPLFALATVGCFLLAACSGCSGGKKKPHSGAVESPINRMVQELDETPDEAFLATLYNYERDSIYVTVRKTKRKAAFAYGEALSNGMLHGTIRKGDTYSILPDGKRKTVSIAVNTTELSGRWFYDLQQNRGVSFNEGGGMSSINAEEICFREWKLLNGRMYIYYVDMQQLASDRHQYLVEEAYITSLNAKELIIQFRGERMRCVRPAKKPLQYKGT